MSKGKTIKTSKTVLKADMKQLYDTDVERALTSGRWQVLQKIAFLSANEVGGCFATKKALANLIGIPRSSLYDKLKFLKETGLVKVGTAPHPRSGDDCAWHFVDFKACQEFARRHREGQAERKERRAAAAREGRAAAAERKREEMRAEILSEMRGDVEEAERARAQREREGYLRDALTSEVDGLKQERDQMRADLEAELEELRAEVERERAELASVKQERAQHVEPGEIDLSRMTTSEIKGRFKDSASRQERLAMLKWAYNRTVPAGKQANGNFDPQPLITEYGSLGGALEGLLGQVK